MGPVGSPLPQNGRACPSLRVARLLRTLVCHLCVQDEEGLVANMATDCSVGTFAQAARGPRLYGTMWEGVRRRAPARKLPQLYTTR